MKYEKRITVIKDGRKMDICYFVREKESSEFDCVMYNVGIDEGEAKKEIDDFSPDEEEAKRLCDYLYERNVTGKNLFDVSEEFITAL